MPDVSAQTAAADSAEPAPLANYTTLRLGGPPRRLVLAEETGEIVQGVREAELFGQPVLILAGGSNLVIGDDGFPGTVILIRSRGYRVVAQDDRTVTLRVEAGEPWDDLVAATVENGWSGLECLSGIPGSAGATPIQNVGAYGQEVAETVAGVEAYDRVADEVVRLTPQECAFAYRSSIFRHSDRWTVLSVDFTLQRSPLSTPVRYAELARALGVGIGDHVPLAQARATVRALRAGKGMVLDPADPDTRSVGSFFTNPVLDVAAYDRLVERSDGLGEPPSWPTPSGVVKVSAAWLIDKAGFGKGYRGAGGAAISSKHTLALTNPDSGTTAALIDLAREIRDGVHDRFGVTLHPEPVLVNCTL
ncbi:UDP-N-acetylmuramate dehydrogenase [Micromonospora pisi]|uniref:UDP-N-acetylenolpyruvoylglucosamine reductase n=1 Tax=Micromonospora pisi TaxID=589240 RepID=A0A495JIP9_9ACTN|nr:UDP-N-acetylmuramate dehydrogenase [Micromonospora pisi]RKR88797.1 UDP-N-acetylmuramate dehydrogenase [Micromonospora pisi]